MKKIGIIGTRRRDSGMAMKVVEEQLREIYTEDDWLISGGCPKGGDKFANILAKKYGIPILIFYPNWDKYGKAAGLIRNDYIAEHSDVIIACVAKDRTGGTEDTIKKFIKRKPNGKVYIV